MAASDDGTHTDEMLDALCFLTSNPLKIAAALYSVTDGKPWVSVPRDDLLSLLEGLEVGNVSNALQAGRVAAYEVDWFLHNNGRASAAELQLTQSGVNAVRALYTSVAGVLDRDALDAMTAAIKELAVHASSAGNSAAAKRPRRTPPAGAEVLVQEVEVMPEEQDSDTIDALMSQLGALRERFDAEADPATLAEAFGAAVADFYKDKRRPPTTTESAELLQRKRTELAAGTALGTGQVTRAEVDALICKVEAAAQLPHLVAAIVQRAQE